MKIVAHELLFLVSFLCVDHGFSQAIRSPISAPYVGTSTYSSNNTDAFSFTANQAALGKLIVASAGVYAEKRFLVNELGFYDAVIVVPTHSGNFGLDARYFGFTEYNEMQLGLAYARSLGNKIDVGIQFNYYEIRIPGYGNAPSINFEAGTIMHFTNNFSAGLHMYNPTGSKLGKNGDERLACIYGFGIAFEPSKDFLFTVRVDKEENKSADIIASMQYKFLSSGAARLGISVTTSSMYLGFGFGLGSIRVDATANYHPQLGVTPGLMLLFTLKRAA